tara:strand:- start:1619 stop:1906 length:288 start_codon:yes stop_codon:yes gene_type:complete
MSKFTLDQVEWAKTMLRRINDRGTWGVPANGCVYQFFHGPKEIHLVKGDTSKDDWHELNTQLFGELGYTVLDRRQENKGRKIKVDFGHGQGKTWN